MTSTESPTTTWFIVSQVKSNRVVYFTDDVDYTPPMQGDWYYVSPYPGPLPEGMSLRNCWRWRFDGHEFIDAEERDGSPQQETLLDTNKAALRMLLSEKINALRRPYAASSVFGEKLRAAKLAQAKALLDGTFTEVEDSHLADAAAAANWTMQDMAQRIVQLDADMNVMLSQTERVRVRLLSLINLASEQSELIALRHRIMAELLPARNTPITPEHTTERQLTAAPSDLQLQQERVRLSLQLREKINDLRRPYVSQYLLDDIVLKHKGQIARAVLANGGSVPPGPDSMVLVSHAAARGQTLLAAANEVLTEMNETARILLATEQLKDAWSVRIAGVESFKDIEILGRAIGKLQLTLPETPGVTGAPP